MESERDVCNLVATPLENNNAAPPEDGLTETELLRIASFPLLNPNPVLEVSRTGTITFCNPATRHILQEEGLDPEEVWRFIPSDMPELLQTLSVSTAPQQMFREVSIGSRIFRESILLSSETGTARIYAIDITDLKQAEGKASRSRAELEAILESLPDPVVFATTSREISYVNPAFTEGFGYFGEEVLGRTTDFLYARHEDFLEQGKKRYTPHGPTECTSFQAVYRRKDGSTFDAETSGTAVKSPTGEVIGFFGIHRNITERKRLENELRMSETEFRTIFQLSTTGKAQVDVSTRRFIRVNDAFCRITGYPEEELLALRFRELTHPEDREHDLALFSRVASGEMRNWKNEKRYIRKDGTVIWVTVSGTMIIDAEGRPVTTIADIEDVTERRKAEDSLRQTRDELEQRVRERTAELTRTVEALRRSEERYALSIEANNSGIWEWDPADDTYLSPMWKTIHGFRDDELPDSYQTWVRLLHPDDLSAATIAFSDFVEGKESRYNVMYRGRHRDGTYRWISSNAVAIRDSSGRATRITGMITDITASIMAEAAVIESEHRLRAILEALPVGVLLLSTDGTAIFHNSAMAQIRGEMACPSYFRAWQDNGDEVHAEQCSSIRALRNGEIIINEILEIERPDGTRRIVFDSAVPVRTPEGVIEGVVVINDDITDFRNLQQQLLQAQKMESIGLLAGGIAHDFNNLLTAIQGYGELVRDEVEQSANEALVTAVDTILNAGNRAAELTAHLLAFSRKQTLRMTTRDVNEVIINVFRLLARIIGEDIHLDLALAPQPVSVNLDASQFDQVLINLATNARDAMQKGGTLRISTDVEEVSPMNAALLGLESSGKYGVVIVADTGCGMDEKAAERIFEPFYTTKPVGKGTGLGLSISYGIVKQHRGAISVESDQGKGTTFRIYLPITTATAAQATAGARAAGSGGSEKILVVEDDELVRGYLRMILSKAGYTVVDAANAAEALAKFLKEGADLVITDVVMPGSSGKDLADQIRCLSQFTKVIYTSGYTREIINARGILDEEVDYLTKPFDRPVLLAKVREVLGRQEQATAG